MDTLDKARAKINEVDRELARLFVTRMHAVEEVARYKEARGLPIFDEKREREVLEKSGALVDDDTLRSYFLLFMEETMKLSKTYQKSLMTGAPIAYSGVEGAFAHIAAKKLFPTGSHVAYGDFASAYAAVEKGECELCVLPIENSFAGEVAQVLDLAYQGSLSITGVYELRVKHNLLALPSADPQKIRTVLSHPQALDQCAGYIRSHALTPKEAVNTAVAAETVAAMKDETVAAIASAETAALYGLTVIDHDINESDTNTTRFAVFSRTPNRTAYRKGDVFLLFFTIQNTAGALAKAVNVISAYGFNMHVLRSRPVKDKPFQYYFYVEAEGDDQSERGQAMLNALSVSCQSLKVVGRYTPESKTES